MGVITREDSLVFVIVSVTDGRTMGLISANQWLSESLWDTQTPKEKWAQVIGRVWRMGKNKNKKTVKAPTMCSHLNTVYMITLSQQIFVL